MNGHKHTNMHTQTPKHTCTCTQLLTHTYTHVIHHTPNPAQVSMWYVDQGTELMSLEAAVMSRPLACAFSPDDSKPAITENGGNIMVWNVVAGCQW